MVCSYGWLVLQIAFEFSLLMSITDEKISKADTYTEEINSLCHVLQFIILYFHEI